MKSGLLSFKCGNVQGDRETNYLTAIDTHTFRQVRPLFFYLFSFPGTVTYKIALTCETCDVVFDVISGERGNKTYFS